MARERAPFFNRDALRKQKRKLGALLTASAVATGATAAYITQEGRHRGDEAASVTQVDVSANMGFKKPRKLTALEMRKIHRYNQTPEQVKVATSIQSEAFQPIYDGRVVLEHGDAGKLISPVLVQEEPLKTVGRGQNLTAKELLSGSFAFATVKDIEDVPAVTITRVEPGMELQSFTPRHEGQPLVINVKLGGGDEGEAYQRGVDQDNAVLSQYRIERDFAFYLPPER